MRGYSDKETLVCTVAVYQSLSLVIRVSCFYPVVGFFLRLSYVVYYQSNEVIVGGLVLLSLLQHWMGQSRLPARRKGGG